MCFDNLLEKWILVFPQHTGIQILNTFTRIEESNTK